jgi:hypothetical protein
LRTDEAARVQPLEDGDEILGDLDLRGLEVKLRLTEDDKLEILLTDGESAVVLHANWTLNLDQTTLRTEHVAHVLLDFVELLRARSERLSRQVATLCHVEMGVTSDE